MSCLEAAFSYADATCKMFTEVIQTSRFGKVAVRRVLASLPDGHLLHGTIPTKGTVRPKVDLD